MSLKVGVPKEIKTNETRVALTPGECVRLIKGAGISVFIEKGAGIGSGFLDEEYEEVGATILPDAKALYGEAELIVKVKEPQSSELSLLEKRHTLFCFLHLGGEPELTKSLMEIGLDAYAYETICHDGETACLSPMSAIAGRIAVLNGATFLQSNHGGRGTLLGGLSMPKSAAERTINGNVTIIGAGSAGRSAARLAYTLGCHVRVVDIQEERLLRIKEELPLVETIISGKKPLERIFAQTDLLIGAVYVMGKTAPHVVDNALLEKLPKGAVAIDIAIDQGGCLEASRPCTHSHPYFLWKDRIISAITNLPAAVPRSASAALSQAIAPYVKQLAHKTPDKDLARALNVSGGKLMIELK